MSDQYIDTSPDPIRFQDQQSLPYSAEFKTVLVGYWLIFGRTDNQSGPDKIFAPYRLVKLNDICNVI
ncbi:MAG: hypothetical protein WC832_04975 [Anaerolineales bacterium]